jgi:hypothetical protein
MEATFGRARKSEGGKMSDQPKPTTGEWNPVALSVRLPQVETVIVVQLCKEHNAALATERNIGWNEGREHERKCNEAALAAVEKVRDEWAEEFVRVRDELKVAGEHAMNLHKQLAAEREKVRELERWKESAIAVMPDYQAVGRELGLRLGESVHDKILPAIQQLREQRDEAIRLLEYKEKQLADERKASSLLSIQLMDYHGKLAAALLANTAALDAAISEAHSEGRRKQAAYEVEHHQKPLVDALTKARKDLGCVSIDAIGRDIDDALAKVGKQ